MAIIYCYAPFSGNTNARTHYCGGGTHTSVSCIGGSQPIDIFAGVSTAVKLYVSTMVPKIRISHCSGVCADTSLTPWTYGMKVELFKDAAATQLLGIVGFGHLTNRHATGVHNNTWGLTLGNLPSSDCACGCSSGSHSHMQGDGTANAYTNCGWVGVTAGSSWMYQWVWNL